MLQEEMKVKTLSSRKKQVSRRLLTSPTYLQQRVGSEVDDYRKK